LRLDEKEIAAIKRSFMETFKEGELYLFGSRVDDGKKGGDIDLYIVPNARLSHGELFDRKIAFLGCLQERIDEQKIDVLISKDKKRPIEQEALKGEKLI